MKSIPTYPKESLEERQKRHLAKAITMEEARKQGLIPPLTAAQKRIRNESRGGL